MGFRNYIGYVSKEKYEYIKNFSVEDIYNYQGKRYFEKIEDPVSIVDIVDGKLHGLGSYFGFEINEHCEPLFLDKETHDEFNRKREEEIFIIKKEFLKEIIEHYSTKVREMYSKLLKDFFLKDNLAELTDLEKVPKSSIYELVSHLRGMSYEWGHPYLPLMDKPFDLEEENDRITLSYKYEYVIFELVRIYKSFDWKSNVMLYYGY